MSTDYYNSKASVEEYISLARGVNGRELIDKLKQYLPRQSKLLEIGFGPGTDWKILSEDYEVTGSDFSIVFLNHLIAKNPIGHFVQLDAITLRIDEKFDGLYSNKVLHHLKDNVLADSILRQYDVLKANGVICHSFWKGEGSEIFNGLFVNYHSKAYLRDAFGAHFEILMLENYAEFEDGDSLLLIGKKRDETP